MLQPDDIQPINFGQGRRSSDGITDGVSHAGVWVTTAVASAPGSVWVQDIGDKSEHGCVKT